MYGAEQASGYSPSKTWQNLVDLVEFGRSYRCTDIVNIAVETGRQNMAEHSRIQQIAVDCCRLRQSRNWSLIAESVETGKYI